MLVRDSQGRRGVFLGTILSQRDFQDLNALAGGDRDGRAELAGRAISEWLAWRRRAGAIPPQPDVKGSTSMGQPPTPTLTVDSPDAGETIRFVFAADSPAGGSLRFEYRLPGDWFYSRPESKPSLIGSAIGNLRLLSEHALACKYGSEVVLDCRLNSLRDTLIECLRLDGFEAVTEEAAQNAGECTCPMWTLLQSGCRCGGR